ncbi:MFS transporter [Nocardioides limicola]|uniref:MFS transporter n=1 Tax=Nocardioides limicola TaxID=2803368 RepID=UPI00193B2213|nr:MFS transporter [Nocardioides sp. DJM-14]
MTPPSLSRDRNFRHLWAGETIAQFGVQIGQIAIPVIAVHLLMASEFQIGLLNTFATAAFLLIGLPAGAWVDRWLKRRVMIAADLVRAGALTAIPLLWYTDALQIWHLYAVAAVLGVATTFFDVSYQSYVPILVRPDQISSANSRLEASFQVARIAGPGVGGLALKVISAPLLVIADAVGYLVSALFLARIRDTEVRRTPAERDSLLREIGEGLGFVWRHDLIRRITLCTAIGNFGMTMVFTLAPLLILRTLGFEPWMMGLAISVGAVGGIVGAALTPALSRRIGEGTVIPVAAVGMGVAGFLLPLTVLAPTQPARFAMLVVAEFAISFGVLAYNVTQVSMRQRVCPRALLGRMNASIRCLVWGVMPISAFVAGVVASQVGVVPTVWLGCGISFVAAAPVLFSPLRGMRSLPDAETAQQLR